MNSELEIGHCLGDVEEETILKTLDETVKLEEPEVDMDDYTSSETSTSSPTANSPCVVAPVKLEEEIPEQPQFLEVTCGSLTGILHTKHFICPGIRVPCIEVSDEPGKLLTPVDFTVKAEKSRQKDWKGAIKHNGRMLRTLMEYEQLDFYNHKFNCSAKCHSRNYITSKCERAQKTPKSQKHAKPYDRPNTPPKTVMKYEELMRNPQIQAYLMGMMEQQKRKEIVEEKLMKQHKQAIIQNILNTDPNSFFATVVQSNQITKVMTSIIQQIGSVAQNLANKIDFQTNATKLCRIMQILGMTDQIAEELTAGCNLPLTVEHQGAQVPLIPSTPPTPASLQNLPILNNNHLSSSDLLQEILKQCPPQ